MTKQYNILVTRPKHQAETLSEMIDQQGWNAIRCPTLKIVAVDNGVIKQQFATIGQYQWVIFISVNAVNFAIRANDGKIDYPSSTSIAAVGKATAKELKAKGIAVDLIPTQSFNTEGLLATQEMQQVKDKSCLIVRGKGGREVLADCLTERGAKVDYLEVYAREKPVLDNFFLIDLLKEKELHAITITSGAALINLLEMITGDLHDSLKKVPLIVVSNRIKELAETKGFLHIDVTENPSNAAIVKTTMLSKKHNN